ncbi:MAG: ISL3 family transposase, partial [Veillonella sp.]|nr:ISL3 family transposase [Veillonella sp.]
HSILDILPARNTEAMLRYFATFTHAQRQQVKFFVMDMSSQFRYVVETMFPNANIVADRYHVTRLVTWAVEAVRKREQRKLAAASRTLKQNKAVLLKQSHRLTEQDSIKLSEIFRISPDLKTAYKLKQYFYILYSQLGKENIQRALILWLEEVKNSGLPEFNSLLKSMSQWNDYIVNAFLLPYSNGFIEGCNNKIKVLKRISFGLRNFERFRVRILLLNAKRSYAENNSA